MGFPHTDGVLKMVQTWDAAALVERNESTSPCKRRGRHAWHALGGLVDGPFQPHGASSVLDLQAFAALLHVRVRELA